MDGLNLGTGLTDEDGRLEYDVPGIEAFFTALGELRGVFGEHIAKILLAYGIEIEEQLASILPMETKEFPDAGQWEKRINNL